MTQTKHPSRWKPGQSGNPKGRPPVVEKIRQLLEPHREELVARAVQLALEGDGNALRICIDRLGAPLRPETPPVSIPGLAEAQGLTAKAERIVAAVGQGEISPDTAAMLLSAVGNYAKAVEIDQLNQRLLALEMRDLL